MSETVNVSIDNMISLTRRLIDFPLFFLVLILIVSLGIFLYIIYRIRSRKNKTTPLKYLLATGYVGILILTAMIMDKKMAYLRGEINTLNEKYVELLGRTHFTSSPQISEKGRYDFTELKKVFPDSLKASINSVYPSTDFITITKENPKAKIFITVTDLRSPGVSIQITPKFREKHLTSEFAKQNNCQIAINGEAGESMELNCELGEWTGNWISNGEVILMEDSKERPFLGFAKDNHATYFRENLTDTMPGPDKYNAIWGRFDILISGNVVDNPSEKRPYARTVMGIDESGYRLYLLVADGKRPNYSLGISYHDAAETLLALGAYQAMACDQGGSSCIYIEKLGGIVNRPADSDGYERPVYSHFGIKLQGNE